MNGASANWSHSNVSDISLHRWEGGEEQCAVTAIRVERMSNDDLSGLSSGPSLRKEDILFPHRNGVEQQEYVDLSQTLADWIYATGFRRSAYYLATQLIDAGTVKTFMIYPIIYLYRHYVELALKAIITSASRLLDREITGQTLKALGRHDLWELWQAARPLLDPVCDRANTTPFPAAELDGVASYILQIHEHDPDGQRFRYATTKSRGGNESSSAAAPSLSIDLDIANVRIISMEHLAGHLENIESWFVELEDAKAEWGRTNVFR